MSGGAVCAATWLMCDGAICAPISHHISVTDGWKIRQETSVDVGIEELRMH